MELFFGPLSVFLRFISISALLFSGSSFSQVIGPESFKPLQSAGKVPDYFRQPLKDQENSFERFLEQGKDKKAQEKVLNMFRYSNYHVREKFNAGFVLFGETLSDYVQAVTAHILKSNPQLPSDIKVFVMRAPDVNAATYAPGIILVNIGMLAHVNSEAELASVLCHEMAHFTQKHSVLDVYDAYEENRKKKRAMWVDDYMEYQQAKVDRHYSRNRRQEFEADSLGMLYFKNTGYDARALTSLFYVLHNADNSWGNVPVNLDFFKIGGVGLPDSYYLETIKVSAAFEEKSDRYYTHPNAGARLKAVERLSTGAGVNGKAPFITVKEPQFQELRDLARFEQLRLMLSYGQFGDVIYNSYALLQKYPGNRYLETSISKSLYGLARYKNDDEYNLVARSYTQVEGECQRVHYLLKQFNRKQLNAYALKNIIHTGKKHPGQPFLDSLESDLVRDMVVINELKPENLEGNNAVKDEFLITLMKDEIKDPPLRRKFETYYNHLEKKKADDIKSYKDRENEKLALEKALKKNGPGIKAARVVLAPSVAHLDKEGHVQPEMSEALRQGMIAALNETSKKTSLGCAQMCASNDAMVAEDYNRLSLMNQCVLEFNLHRSYRVRPLNADHVWKLADEYETPLVFFTSCHYSEKSKNFRYIASLYNMRSCRVVHYSSHTGKGEPSQKELQAFLEKDFETVKR